MPDFMEIIKNQQETIEKLRAELAAKDAEIERLSGLYGEMINQVEKFRRMADRLRAEIRRAKESEG